MDAIREAFSEYFSHWSIELPPQAPADRRSGELRQAGWLIRYRWDAESESPHLDFFAAHRMTNTRLERIHADGRIETLGAEQEMVVYDPDEPGDQERAQRRMEEHNQAFESRLRELGLEQRPTDG